MATRITPARRAPEASNRKPRQRAAAPAATSLDLQAAVNAAVREALDPHYHGGQPSAVGAMDIPPATRPPIDAAIDEAFQAIEEMHMTVDTLTERLSRTVLAPAPVNQAVADGMNAASAAPLASPVLLQIGALRHRIHAVTLAVHEIHQRLEA